MTTSGRSGDEHVREWAELHATEPPGGFVGGWLRASASVARPLAQAGVSPNAVTVAALVAAVAALPAVLVDGWLGPALGCLAVTVSGLLDALDGAVAVQAGRTTKVGYLLDSALDRLADAAFPVALAIVAGAPPALAVAATAACWYLEYVRARMNLALTPDERGRQVITPGERPTRIVLTAVGLGLPFLAEPALWAHVVIVGGSALFLLAHAVRRLSRLDRPPPPAA
ncbi:MAG: CDP-alcohol phosphatidyltransferase family protein [Acidimicrobiia bacterium]